MKAQELIFKKDRQIREEAQKFEVVSSTVSDMRREQGLEAEQLRAQLSVEKLKLSEALDRHRREVEDIKSEVAEKIPQLLSSAIEKVWVVVRQMYSSRPFCDIGSLCVHPGGAAVVSEECPRSERPEDSL